MKEGGRGGGIVNANNSHHHRFLLNLKENLNKTNTQIILLIINKFLIYLNKNSINKIQNIIIHKKIIYNFSKIKFNQIYIIRMIIIYIVMNYTKPFNFNKKIK